MRAHCVFLVFAVAFGCHVSVLAAPSMDEKRWRAAEVQAELILSRIESGGSLMTQEESNRLWRVVQTAEVGCYGRRVLLALNALRAFNNQAKGAIDDPIAGQIIRRQYGSTVHNLLSEADKYWKEHTPQAEDGPGGVCYQKYFFELHNLLYLI